MKLANLIRGNDRGAVSLRVVAASAVLAASAGAGGIGFSTAALAAPSPEVVICHATDSVSNPYVIQSPSTTADAGGHGGPGQHTDPVFPGSTLTGKWGDIIPPFLIDGSTPPATYPGLNYSGTGLLIHENGCDLPPDLRIDKAGPATGFLNETGTYVLTVSNPVNGPSSGPANARITVTDTVPNGWTPISATPQSGMGFTCAIVAQVITCLTDTNLGQGDTFTITVVIRYDQIGLRTNTGRVASPSDSNTGNNSDTVDTLVGLRPAPDLTLAKSAPGNAVVGDTGSYVLTVTNSGNAPTAGTITVSDTLPGGVTAGVLPAACALTAGVITCTAAGPLAPAGTVAFTIPVTFSSVGTQVNNATVSGGGESNTANNGASATTVVAGIPDLTLAKSAPRNAVVGDAGSYVLTVTNSGNGPTAGTITVSDTLPGGVTVGVLPAACALTLGVITCTAAGPLAPAGTVAFTIPVTFGSVGTLVNNATVSGGGERNTGNNGASATTVVTATPVPDLVLAKAAPATKVVGEAGSYVLTVTNDGTGPTTGTITVSDTLPGGVTAGVLPAACALTAGVITCTAAGPLAPAGTVAFTIPVTFSSVGTQVNNATVSGGGESNTGNNGASATTVVAGIPDLTLAKSAPGNAVVGGAGSYVLTVTNSGNGPTAGTITVSDTLPGGVTAGVLPAACALTAGVITCTAAGPLAPAGTVAFTIPVTFSSVGTQVNNATVSGGGERNTGNNGASATTVVTDPQGPPPLVADLAVKKTGPASVTPGGTASWVLTVTNKGPGNAAGFSVTDTLPAGVSLTSIAGPGFTCTAATAVCTFGGVLLPGQTAAVNVVGSVASTVAGNSIANVVVVGPPDATPSDNTDTLVSVIERPAAPGQADLVLAKSAPAAVLPGDPITWTITVTNAGTADASGFTVADPLALGLTLVQAVGEGFTCAGSSVVCTYAGTLGPNQVATLLVTAALAEDYTSSSVANTATAALGGDPTPANNTDTATTAVNQPLGGVVEEPATAEEPTPAPIAGVDEQPATAPARPRVLPFTGGSADSLLALAASLSLAGLALALVGRRRRTVE